MKKLHIPAFCLSVLLFAISSSAQRPEVMISLNEGFFDALLDSIFGNFAPPEFSIAGTGSLVQREPQVGKPAFRYAGLNLSEGSRKEVACGETVKLLRDNRGVKTAVRLRDGKVTAPLAFTGTYLAPLLGCFEFSGLADSNLELEFDPNSQRLLARVKVNSVNLNGTGGIGGSLVAKMVQGSIDRKMNPIEVISLEKVSFSLPVQGAGTLKMRATRIKTEVGNGVLNVKVEYDFVKG